ncbi:hypothetical protein F5X96DRAFT_593165 [Biscogniauxia mediterranea]|nr:hypothetical protein F5X96DRAFT_593165 [Biscogniauxia mediterranea]
MPLHAAVLSNGWAGGNGYLHYFSLACRSPAAVVPRLCPFFLGLGSCEREPQLKWPYTECAARPISSARSLPLSIWSRLDTTYIHALSTCRADNIPIHTTPSLPFPIHLRIFCFVFSHAFHTADGSEMNPCGLGLCLCVPAAAAAAAAARICNSTYLHTIPYLDRYCGFALYYRWGFQVDTASCKRDRLWHPTQYYISIRVPGTRHQSLSSCTCADWLPGLGNSWGKNQENSWLKVTMQFFSCKMSDTRFSSDLTYLPLRTRQDIRQGARVDVVVSLRLLV